MSDTSSFGYGQEQPNDSGSDHDVIAFICDMKIAKIWTMIPVKVVAVHAGAGNPPAAGTVDVLPLVSQIDGNGYGTPHGTVYGIPWSRMQGGASAIVIDPVVGDLGYIDVASRDISKVKSTKAAALPGSRRRYNLADGIYSGAILNAAPTSYIQATADGHWKIVDLDGNSIITAASGITLTDKTGNVIQTSSTGIALTPFGGQPVTVNGALVVTGNIQAGGALLSQTGSLYTGNIHTSGTITGDTDVIAAGKSGAHHVHGGVATGGGSTLQPT
jgi:hypothetical protein